MIINFSVENWRSFREKTIFSMVAGKESQHRDRTMVVEKPKMRLLPIAAIYGGNASGKTNLFQALYFAKRFIILGTNPENLINVEPFLLDSTYINIPSRFIFELLIEGKCYEYSFAVTQNEVVEEKLIEILATSEKIRYQRYANNKIEFPAYRRDKELGRLNFTAEATRKNQLFLTSSVELNIEHFKSIYNWFKKTLVLVAPDTRFGTYDKFFTNGEMNEKMNQVLSQLDTGIASIGSKPVSIENLPLSEGSKSKIVEGGNIFISWDERRFVISRKDGKLSAEELIFFHQASDGTKVPFKMGQESDGTQRVIELLPSFLDVTANDTTKVYIFDELDRSLHTLLTRGLIEGYLATRSLRTMSQLLFTAHDTGLFDQILLRRDEIWIVERDNNGCSTLRSLSEFKDIRYDKDIRKSYLQGRMGGVPKITLSGKLVK